MRRTLDGVLVDLGGERKEHDECRARLDEAHRRQHGIEMEMERVCDIEKEKIRDQFTSEIDDEKERAVVAQEQCERMAETLSTLNGIFATMRTDADHMRVQDLRDACTALERRLEMREKELLGLRPLSGRAAAQKLIIGAHEVRIAQLEKELSETKSELAQRDTLCEELMQREGERLSELEMLAGEDGVEGGDGGGTRRSTSASGGGGGGAGGTGSVMCVRCNRALDAANDIDDVLGDEAEKRLPCTNYRILLPNLMGYRPERDRTWVLRCIRGIFRAKQRRDAVAERTPGCPRARFPEFVCSWFQPSIESMMNLAPQERDRSIAKADEDRWALYYGAKVGLDFRRVLTCRG